MIIQRLMFGLRLHEAPHIGDIGENEPKPWNGKLLVVLGSFHFNIGTLRCYLLKTATFSEGAIVESVNAIFSKKCFSSAQFSHGTAYPYSTLTDNA